MMTANTISSIFCIIKLQIKLVHRHNCYIHIFILRFDKAKRFKLTGGKPGVNCVGSGQNKYGMVKISQDLHLCWELNTNEFSRFLEPSTLI